MDDDVVFFERVSELGEDAMNDIVMLERSINGGFGSYQE